MLELEKDTDFIHCEENCYDSSNANKITLHFEALCGAFDPGYPDAKFWEDLPGVGKHSLGPLLHLETGSQRTPKEVYASSQIVNTVYYTMRDEEKLLLLSKEPLRRAKLSAKYKAQVT